MLSYDITCHNIGAVSAGCGEELVGQGSTCLKLVKELEDTYYVC